MGITNKPPPNGGSTDEKTFATISKDMNLKFKIGLQLFCLLTQKVAKDVCC